MAKSSVQGDKALLKALKKLGPAANKILRKELRAATKEIAAAVKAVAPVGETKQLRRAIKVRSLKRKKGRIGLRISIDKGQDQKFYAPFVELGDSTQKGQDFMEKPFEQLAPPLAEDLPRRIWARIEAEAKKGAKK